MPMGSLKVGLHPFLASLVVTSWTPLVDSVEFYEHVAEWALSHLCLSCVEPCLCALISWPFCKDVMVLQNHCKQLLLLLLCQLAASLLHHLPQPVLHGAWHTLVLVMHSSDICAFLGFLQYAEICPNPPQFQQVGGPGHSARDPEGRADCLHCFSSVSSLSILSRICWSAFSSAATSGVVSSSLTTDTGEGLAGRM